MSEIGTPTWDACETCRHYEDADGCNRKISVSYSPIDDAFLCDDYRPKCCDGVSTVAPTCGICGSRPATMCAVCGLLTPRPGFRTCCRSCEEKDRWRLIETGVG
jgi:hypothetical protein